MEEIKKKNRLKLSDGRNALCDMGGGGYRWVGSFIATMHAYIVNEAERPMWKTPAWSRGRNYDARGLSVREIFNSRHYAVGSTSVPTSSTPKPPFFKLHSTSSLSIFFCPRWPAFDTENWLIKKTIRFLHIEIKIHVTKTSSTIHPFIYNIF